MEIIRQTEFEISTENHQQIIELQQVCFSEAQSRSYFKQLPHFRYLVFADNTLIAHLGVDHRVIRVGDSIFSIFGIIDLCVKPEYRRQGIASQLLNILTELAIANSIDFLFLVSHRDSFYLNNGFEAVSQECTWLGIKEHQNCGILTETIEENLMIKQTGNKAWVDKPIDLLGYMF